MENNNQSLIETLKNITQAYFNVAKDTASLAGAEARLAGKSLINIVALLSFLKYLVVVTWLSICSILALYLISLQYSLLVAFSAVTLLNVLAIIITVSLLLKAKNRLSFPATRRQLQGLNNLEDEYYHEQTKIENKIP